MRAVIPLVWAGALAFLLIRAPQPLAVMLVLQAAVCVSYMVIVAGRSDVIGTAERRAVALATTVWRVVDQLIVDSTMDGIGHSVRGWSGVLRRAQAGSVRVHAAAALAAILAMIGYLLWR